MDRVLKGLQPEKVFCFFEELTKIPRGSTHEKAVSDYLYRWAIERKLDVVQDAFLNILIRKPGSAGYENAPAVILQGHMDMVCEKNMDVVHDFLTEPLKLRVDGDYVYATGTTLGADNGIGVACTMALLDSQSLSHPPLEVLITADEEDGMTGAEGFDATQLKGRILINLDDEYEGKFTAGCAGGCTVKLFLPAARKAPGYGRFCRIAVKGLKGGHSGDDIDKERGNSIKLMGRMLYDLRDRIEIASISGGAKGNAIPRESRADLAVSEEIDMTDFINKWNTVFKNEFMFSDPDVSVSAEIINEVSEVYTGKVKDHLINAVSLIPNGPIVRSPELNMVIYSNNLGVIASEADVITLTCVPRSSSESMMKQFIDTAEQISEILQIKMELSSGYPAWEYQKESAIRELCMETYEDMYGVKGEVSIIHAGLECGLFIKKIPGLDAIATGPNLYDIHTPNEHFSISSVRRTFDFICRLLEKIK
ncbi:MAG TPA: aminoacyl-histidine dipeptidase [Anaerovoracaceae bacterium]|nr:aminoacyl-histidine dipeptidase [Anaerovoracaceae bacterium]